MLLVAVPLQELVGENEKKSTKKSLPLLSCVPKYEMFLLILNPTQIDNVEGSPLHVGWPSFDRSRTYVSSNVHNGDTGVVEDIAVDVVSVVDDLSVVDDGCGEEVDNDVVEAAGVVTSAKLLLYL